MNIKIDCKKCKAGIGGLVAGVRDVYDWIVYLRLQSGELEIGFFDDFIKAVKIKPCCFSGTGDGVIFLALGHFLCLLEKDSLALAVSKKQILIDGVKTKKLALEKCLHLEQQLRVRFAEADKYLFSMGHSTFLEAIKLGKEFVTKDNMVRVFQRIFIEGNKKQVIFSACDKFRHSRLFLPCIVDKPFAVDIESGYVSAVLYFLSLKGGAVVKVYDGDGVVKLVCGDDFYVAGKNNEDYPDLGDMLKKCDEGKDEYTSFVVRRLDIVNFLKSHKHFLCGASLRCRFGDVLRLSLVNDNIIGNFDVDFETSYSCEPIRRNGKVVDKEFSDVRMRIDYLKSFLANFNAELLEFRFRGKGVFFEIRGRVGDKFYSGMGMPLSG